MQRCRAGAEMRADVVQQRWCKGVADVVQSSLHPSSCNSSPPLCLVCTWTSTSEPHLPLFYYDLCSTSSAPPRFSFLPLFHLCTTSAEPCTTSAPAPLLNCTHSAPPLHLCISAPTCTSSSAPPLHLVHLHHRCPTAAPLLHWLCHSTFVPPLLNAEP